MLIELNVPASLPLGLVQLEAEAGLKTCLLGFTLQHPPVHLQAQAHPELVVSGPRADKAYEQAGRFSQHHGLKTGAEVEIELAIPALMGLGSEAMLGLGIAQALAWVHELSLPEDKAPQLAAVLGLEPGHALELWGFDRGGLLLVDTRPGPTGQPDLIRRQEIAHKEKDAWAFVFVLPRVPKDTPETLETDRLAHLLQAAPHLSPDSGRLVTEELWPAVAADDIAAFGQGLMRLQQMNQTALARARTPVELSDDHQATLDLMHDHGAFAWGQSPTGLCLYALVRGAKDSIDLRQKLRQHLSVFGGTIMATITDNDGARYTVQDKTLAADKPRPIRTNVNRDQ
jgi:predicted sugar kinase